MSKSANPGEQISLRANVNKSIWQLHKAESRVSALFNAFTIAEDTFKAKEAVLNALTNDSKTERAALDEAAARVGEAADILTAATRELQVGEIMVATIEVELASAIARAKAAYAI